MLGFRVRLMSPLGRYPADNFCSDSDALIVSPEICFSIVRVGKGGLHWGFSEVEILTVPELPLIGCILLAGEAGHLGRGLQRPKAEGSVSNFRIRVNRLHLG
jgi:hypothetical protein